MDPELISGLIRKTVLCIEYLDLEIGKKGTTSSFFNGWRCFFCHFN